VLYDFKVIIIANIGYTLYGNLRWSDKPFIHIDLITLHNSIMCHAILLLLSHFTDKETVMYEL
jgi:hypothetical protein